MQKSNDPALFWLGLSSIPGVGRITFRKLIGHFGSAERALAASSEELGTINGLPHKAIAAIAESSWHEHAEQELKRARELDVRIITAESREYPARLRDTPDPPLFLYVKGTLKQDDGFAVVGTRRPTQYGLGVTRRIASDLAAAGLTIVSGLARGIDTEAHRGALQAKGRTIAVLGCGIDVVYPPENRGLMQAITRSGAVVTENPFGTQPEAGYFPARNRIISGLSRGTVIVEATADSGSLITAKYTLEQGRKLFAVPGNIGSPNSRGTHSLIKQGAILAEGSDDILKNLGLATAGRRREPRPLPVLNEEENAVARCVLEDPKHIDMIMKESGLKAGMLSAVLVTLELKGMVKQLPGKYYIRSEEARALEA
jgi:DNA processing protein